MTTTEAQSENQLIEKLSSLKYGYRQDIRDRAALERNFREKFEALNRVTLTPGEFPRLLEEITTPDVFTAARTLRERNSFTRDDGTPLNYTLVNIKDWCKNTFEVINQLRINTDNSHRRYDVILLINGVLAVQIELKTLGISPRRAMEQIVDYKNDFGNGYTKTLLCFLQLFIVSNRSETWYFANNNARHFAFNADERFLPVYQFAAEDNQKITHLDCFAESFLLAKCTLGQTISRYMVLIASEQKLMMMRPYQVYAVKQIVDCIHQNCGNGYIWHTTGSGKTLTSFKASTLLKDNPDIEKCLFVVDRKDLDRQTREEFNKFQEGCVEENTNTGALVRRLLSDDYADKVIVCTIQKLGLALDENSTRNKQQKKDGRQTYKEQLEPLRDKRIVFIFDECHRSQFGENHKAIKEFFPKAQLFGFTGTPIFEENASYQQIEGQQASNRTTVDLFQKQLHAYTITHAIEDGNVLRFHVDYFKPKGDAPPKPGEAIAKRAVIEAILTKHNAATGQRRFNALLATASIKAPVVIQKLEAAVRKLDAFMKSQGLDCAPEAVPNLKGDDARTVFINHFKEVQRLKTQLDQYTDLTDDNAAAIEQILPRENLLGFRGAYLETAQRLKTQQGKGGDKPTPDVDQIDFEFVLFASALIDYDYIMGLISRFSQQTPGKQKMSREQLIGLIQSDAKFMNEREDIAAYIATLKAGEGLSESAIRAGYTRFKAEKDAQELAAIASQHRLATAALQSFVDGILQRMIFDGEQLSDLMTTLELGWKARTQAELALMEDLHPLLTRRAQGRDISGLSAYEQ
ncbi:type I restriction enzyme, R subunit [Gammaproteobacteria bacterium]